MYQDALRRENSFGNRVVTPSAADLVVEVLQYPFRNFKRNKFSILQTLRL